MENLFRDFAINIKIFVAIENVEDPYEHNTTFEYLNPIPIKALVNDLSFSKAQWSLPGIASSKVKEIIFEKKHLSLLLKSSKIEIELEDYEGYKINGKLSYKVEDQYVRAFCYIKKV